MIKAEDLRLGNLIYALHEESESVTEVDIWFLEHQLMYDKDPHDDIFSRGWPYDGIELNEEWLIKCCSTGQLQCETIGSVFYLYTEFGDFTANSNVVQYVHQLQNLYRDLTGKDLTLSSPV